MIIKRLLLIQAVLALGLGSVFLIPQRTDLGPSGIAMVLPEKVGRWSAGPVGGASEAERAGLALDTEFLRRTYTNAAHDQIEVSVVLSGADMVNSIHRPERCLVAQGWTVEKSRMAAIPLSGGKAPLGVIELTNVREWRASERSPVVALRNINCYWFIGARESTASHWRRTYVDIRDRLLHGENQRWAYVTVAAVVTDSLDPVAGRNQADTTQMIEEFIAEIVPQFQTSRGGEIAADQAQPAGGKPGV